MTRTPLAWATCALALAALTACSDDAGGQGTSSSSDAATSSHAATSSGAASGSQDPSTQSPPPPGAVGLYDGWVKAAEEDMTAVFGRLQNPLPVDVTFVSGSTDVAESVELHEVAGGSMQPVEGGMTVPRGEVLELEPGGLHIMLMGVKKPIVAGDEVVITLEDADGKTYELTAQARTFDGGDEDYEGGDGHSHSH
ncbi:copper chaperone PCu(A)C [Kytococcus sedentarius]|uniref:copper chaperone PCu(A)C n=1 Tax=Kytococcus sedentarius TaxID=1276 RepID=UPI00194ECC1F|nr:copper chaperone PCu(A)C [Kytococcus sedentarius]QRO87615.1 copper chaperone PCu(A)C [Kytococcus sedentarius]